jgi:hypothetical protein
VKNSKKIMQLAIGFAIGYLIIKVISKSASKKDETLVGDAPISEDSSITPISGSSDAILEQLDEEKADELKNELETN